MDYTWDIAWLVVESQGKAVRPNGPSLPLPGFKQLQILPWDSDIDVQMTNTTVHFLASYYNMTIHNFKKRNYLLEVNPKYTDDSYEDYLNVIDARWIDTETGLFIDITAVRPRPGKKNVLCSKDQHEESVSVTQCWMLPGRAGLHRCH